VELGCQVFKMLETPKKIQESAESAFAIALQGT